MSPEGVDPPVPAPVAAAAAAEIPWLRRLARDLLRDEAAADELVQRTWAASLGTLPEAEPSRTTVDQVVESTLLSLEDQHRTALLLHYRPDLRARARPEDAAAADTHLPEALSALRERLDQRHGGRRRAWALLLAAFLPPDPPAPEPPPPTMTTTTTSAGWPRRPLSRDSILGFVAGTMVGFVVLVIFFLARDQRPPAPIPGPPAAAVRIARTGDAGPWTVFGRRIAGRVVGAGQPVAGARVLLAEAGGHCEDRVPVAEARTDLEGRFDFGVRPAQLYLLAGAAAGKAMGVVEVDLRDPAPLPDIDLTLGSCEHALLGTVMSARGTPIPGATVREDGLLGVVTDGAGAFALCVSHHRPDVLVSAPGFASALVAPLLNGPNRVSITLGSGATVAGRVLRPDDDRPVFGARVRATPPPVRRLAWSRSRGPRCTGPRPLRFAAQSDEQGRFRLEGLDPGPWTLAAEAPGHSRGDALELDVAAGRAGSEARLRLGPEAAALHGVMYADGRGVGGIAVLAVDRATGATSPEAVTQADGSFLLEQVPRGVVTIASPHHQIVPDMEIDTRLPPPGVITANLRHGEAIEGRVLSGGKPVAAELRIEGLPSAHTRWDGSFVVRLSSAADPAGGAYAVRAVSRGLHAASEIAQVTLAPGERHKRVDLALAPTGEITGTVVDGESDAPLESMIVSCEPRQGGERRISATGRTGAFRCPLLVREGPYALEVFAPGSGQPLAPARGRFPAVVLPSARARADRVVLAVQLERTQLAGRVVDDTERPVAEARVVATQPRGRAGEDDGSARDLTVSSAPAAVTGADGSFRLDVLAGGAWELRATTAAGATGALPAVTGPRSGVVVRLRAPGAIAGELAGFTRPPRVSIRPLADDAGGAAGTSAGDGGEASAAAAPPLEPEVRRGRFSARALPPGRYLVRADAAAEAAFARVEVAAGRTAAVVLTSGGWGALRGRVLDRSKGAAMAGVWCEAGPSPPERPPAREPGPGAVTDRAGRFVLDRVPAGDLEVRCWADEVAETTARVRVRRDAVTTVELRAAPAPAAPTAPPAPRR